ncbi:hypothetical protein [Candidatus Thiodictyon syntrophicum]|jgi:hypothetical protein|uniref:Uncharacterized protein n=1 Tax=Candidatus Thiodictyon syntrophicum TaxID=1166950 RepID=A0A2K8UEZ9_9GAMM|nr:hypothetical protein [Candidatus Thiodictyon syntrophicum]AUB84122.1 hypothetical protein THSYN_26420 [Candidatus Thiodictyon syntrophicum]
MQQIKQTAEYTIYQKKSGRYAVKAKKQWVKAGDKTKILLAEALITQPRPKPVPEPVAEGETEAPAAS